MMGKCRTYFTKRFGKLPDPIVEYLPATNISENYYHTLLISVIFELNISSQFLTNLAIF